MTFACLGNVTFGVREVLKSSFNLQYSLHPLDVLSQQCSHLSEGSLLSSRLDSVPVRFVNLI